MKKLINKYRPLVIYIAIFLVCFSLFFLYNKGYNTWDIIGAMDSASAIALAVLAFLGYLEYIRSEDEIKIVFDIEGERVDSKLSILRKDLTRSELMGLLGILQKDQKNRFHITPISDPSFLKEIYKVAKGKEKELIIPITKEEAKQFQIDC